MRKRREAPEKETGEREKTTTLALNILKALSEGNRIFPHHPRTVSGERVIRSHPRPSCLPEGEGLLGFRQKLEESCIIEGNCLVRKEKCVFSLQ